MNAWKSIFTLSPVNYGYYDEDELPRQNWQWTKKDLASGAAGLCCERQSVANLKSRKIRRGDDMPTM